MIRVEAHHPKRPIYKRSQSEILRRLRKIKRGLGRIRSRLSGFVAAGKTLDEVKDLIREAVEFHLEGMRAPIPVPRGL